MVVFIIFVLLLWVSSSSYALYLLDATWLLNVIIVLSLFAIVNFSCYLLFMTGIVVYQTSSWNVAANVEYNYEYN